MRNQFWSVCVFFPQGGGTHGGQTLCQGLMAERASVLVGNAGMSSFPSGLQSSVQAKNPQWLLCLLFVSTLGQFRLVPSPHVPGDVLRLPRPPRLRGVASMPLCLRALHACPPACIFSINLVDTPDLTSGTWGISGLVLYPRSPRSLSLLQVSIILSAQDLS